VPTIRERTSDALLHTGIELAADREQMARSLAAAPHTRGYELATSVVATAKLYDSMLLWLSARLRPRPRPLGQIAE